MGHIIVMWYFCMFQDNHHHKSLYHLSSYKALIILLPYSPCCTFTPVTHLLCDLKFVLLHLPHQFYSSPPPQPLWQPLDCFLYLWLCFRFIAFTHLFYFLDSTYKWNHPAFAFLCLPYFIQLNSLLGSSILSRMARSHFFLWLSNLPLSICGWTLVTVNIWKHRSAYNFSN